MIEKECERCGKIFTTRKRPGTKAETGIRGGEGRFCSRHCAYVRPLDETNRLLLRKLTQRIKQCRQCGGIFVRCTTRAYCSDECASRAQRITAREKGGWKTERTCGWCGTEFVAEFTGGSRSCFCSDECKDHQHKENARKNRQTETYKRTHRASKARRRARRRGLPNESIDPFKVFDRDNWTCQICGDKTPRKLRGTCDDKAPELDHIVPLAAGGPHTWDNVQCACRICNQNKGAGSMNSQLRLELSA